MLTVRSSGAPTESPGVIQQSGTRPETQPAKGQSAQGSIPSGKTYEQGLHDCGIMTGSGEGAKPTSFVDYHQKVSEGASERTQIENVINAYNIFKEKQSILGNPVEQLINAFKGFPESLQG